MQNASVAGHNAPQLSLVTHTAGLPGWVVHCASLVHSEHTCVKAGTQTTALSTEVRQAQRPPALVFPHGRVKSQSLPAGLAMHAPLSRVWPFTQHEFAPLV